MTGSSCGFRSPKSPTTSSILASSSSSTTSETPSSSKSMPGPPALPRRPPPLRKGSITSRREGVGGRVGGEVVGRLLGRVGDARREQAVSDGLRVHVGEAVGVEVVDQRLLERLHQPGERTL